MVGVIVAVDTVLVAGIFKYELQKDVAGGPSFLSTVSARLTALQSTLFSKWAGVGSSEAVAKLRVPAAASKERRRMMDARLFHRETSSNQGKAGFATGGHVAPEYPSYTSLVEMSAVRCMVS